MNEHNINEIYDTCDQCNMSFSNEGILTECSKTLSENIIENNGKTLDLEKCKNKKIKNYCRICCKHFKELTAHMAKYHQTVPRKSNLNNKQQLKSTNRLIWTENNVFENFEKELASEFKVDKYRCNLCNIIFENSTECEEHEKNHYRIASDTNFITQETIMQNNNTVVSDTHGTKVSHKKTSILIEKNIQKVQKLGNNKIKTRFVRKSQKARKNMVKQSRDDIQKEFKCTYCKTTVCKHFDEHFKMHQWWAQPNQSVKYQVSYECYVCYQQFSEERAAKLHETDHILKSIC